MKIASWNKRAKYYVITEQGKKGIQDRTNVGEPPPEDCKLKGCTGKEWVEHSGEMDVVVKNDNESKPGKKKESAEPLDISFTTEQNKSDELVEKENWFSSIFGT